MLTIHFGTRSDCYLGPVHIAQICTLTQRFMLEKIKQDEHSILYSTTTDLHTTQKHKRIENTGWIHSYS